MADEMSSRGHAGAAVVARRPCAAFIRLHISKSAAAVGTVKRKQYPGASRLMARGAMRMSAPAFASTARARSFRVERCQQVVALFGYPIGAHNALQVEVGHGV